MENNSTKKPQIKIETLAATLLLIVLAAQTMLLIVSTGNTYKKILSSGNSSKEIRTALCYISTKVRQADNSSEIRIEKTSWNETALVISKNIDNKIFENWIFYYEGTLMDTLIEKGSDINPLSSNTVARIDGLSITQTDKKLSVYVKKSSNNVFTGNQETFQNLDLTLRT